MPEPIETAVDWLLFLAESIDLITHPTLDKLAGCTLWKQDLRARRRLRRFHQTGILETSNTRGRPGLQLSERGRAAAWGGIEPPARWNRPWDGQWRLVLFDLPTHEQSLRIRLWRWLRQERLGWLQNSVWISPDPLSPGRLPLRRANLAADVVTIIEGRPTPPRSDDDLVTSAWDFSQINRSYQGAIEVLESVPKRSGKPNLQDPAFPQWLGRERRAWAEATRLDPLLPASLLPADYLGRTASSARSQLFRILAAESLAGAKSM